MSAIGAFIQNEVFGFHWLKEFFSLILSSFGLDVSSRAGGSILFFFHGTVKITALLMVMIFIISCIQSYFPPERSRRIMGRFSGLGASTVAALLGTVTPFCACSSIPLFIGFTAAGLPLSVTFSFLISSPMVDLGSLVVLMSVFGWKTAVIYVLFGLVVAVAGGSLIGRMKLDDEVEPFIRKAPFMEASQDELTLKDRVSYARDKVKDTLSKVFPYIILGVLLGAVIHNWIPSEWIINILGSSNPLSVVLAVAAGVPMYADIFSTVPVAEALIARGADLGAVLSFMMAVTTLSVPSLIMLRKAVRPKLIVVFTCICTVGIIAVGYVFNFIQGSLI